MNYRPALGFVQSKSRGSIALVLIIATAFALTVTSASPSAAEELTSGTGSRQARQQALQAIPFQQLTQEAQAKISKTLKNPSIYRRLPVTAINIDPDYYLFLARHPEVVVNIWKIMGVTKMSTQRTGPFTLRTNDGVGTVSDVELLYGTENLHIFYGVGTYEGPVLKRKLRGDCVMVLHTNFSNDTTNGNVATSQLDVFLRIDNATVGLVAKTLKPIVGPTADHNFVESLNFLQRLNETTEKNGRGVQQMAMRLGDINSDTRDKFIRIAGAVGERGQGRDVSARPIDPNRPSDYTIPAYSNSGYRPVPATNRPATYNAPIQSNGRNGRDGRNAGAPAYQQHYGSPRTGQLPYQAPVYPSGNVYRR